jgi:hypothetical protein
VLLLVFIGTNQPQEHIESYVSKISSEFDDLIPAIEQSIDARPLKK